MDFDATDALVGVEFLEVSDGVDLDSIPSTDIEQLLIEHDVRVLV